MNPEKFMNFSRKFEDAEICILGVPLDATETYRRGARLGPESIRDASLSVEEYSPVLGLDLSDLRKGTHEKPLSKISL